MTPAPRDRFLIANGLRHHLTEWGETGPVVLFVHGFLEHSRVWDFIAPAVVDAGFRVAALDWRGHGESEWVGRGGYYHFADYVADLAGLVPLLADTLHLVAHSMGANAAILYAGTEPARVRSLTLVDAAGPPDMDPASTPDRYRAWIDDLAKAERRPPSITSIDDGAAKLLEGIARYSMDMARHVTVHGTRAAGAGRVWKFDPRHQTRSPQPFYVRQARAFWEAVTCPVLFMGGGDSPLREMASQGTELDDRLDVLRAERTEIPGSGHHPHLEYPREFGDALIAFLERHTCAD